jgi:hypothetical protein
MYGSATIACRVGKLAFAHADHVGGCAPIIDAIPVRMLFARDNPIVVVRIEIALRRLTRIAYQSCSHGEGRDGCPETA